ncbi:MAG: hypothetical protein ACWGOV_01755 [Acidiferrobacterales bacterium]
MGKTNRIKWITHKGKKILFEDYSGLQENEMLDALHDTQAVYQSLSAPVPVLVDLTNARTNEVFLEEIKRIGKEYEACIARIGNVGVSGARKLLATAYHAVTAQTNKSGYFSNMEDAKNFLAE